MPIVASIGGYRQPDDGAQMRARDRRGQPERGGICSRLLWIGVLNDGLGPAFRRLCRHHL
jgi:hypothetical protein